MTGLGEGSGTLRRAQAGRDAAARFPRAPAAGQPGAGVARAGAWREQVIFDGNLGGHEAVVGDVTGNGRLDVVSRPWRAQPGNAVQGRA